jgi:hypothetical protein
MLVALGSGPGNGCVVEDKLYNNFSYSGGPGAPPSASFVLAHLDDNPPTLTTGWTFTSLLGAFEGNFELGFNVTVMISVCPTCTIISAAEQIFPGTAPPGPQAMSINMSAGIPNVVMLNNVTFGGNTGGNLIPGVLTLSKVAMSSGLDATDPILSFESDVRQINTIPEPVTLSLTGIGLLGLSFIGRRRAQK